LTEIGDITFSGVLLKTLKNAIAKLEESLIEEDIRKLLQESGTLTATVVDADVVDIG
jgi:hypothetical protein